MENEIIYLKISELKLSNYNPRIITSVLIDKLKQSIIKYGVIKPILVNRNNQTILGGHQRIKALKQLGIETVPCILINIKDLNEEKKFNLIHNSIETAKSKSRLKNINIEVNKIIKLDVDNFIIEKSNPNIVKEIVKLMLKYGDFAVVIIDSSNLVVENSEYLQACSILKKKVLCCKLNDTELEIKNFINNKDYGKYYFKTIGINNFLQYSVQLSREFLKSYLYTHLLVPDKKLRYLDFGAGKQYHSNIMKKQGYKIKAYEPFQYTPKKGLDINKVVTQIKEIEQDIIQNGLYDVVILDSVINSVINLDMLNYVLITCNSLLQENGILIATTRSDKTKKVEEAKTAGYNGLKIWFEDDNKFNVRIKHGNPIVQFLPSEDFIKPIINQYFNHCSCKPYSDLYLKIICSNKIRLNNKETYNIALNTEFNMLYPNGYQHNQHKKLVETILKYNGF